MTRFFQVMSAFGTVVLVLLIVAAIVGETAPRDMRIVVVGTLRAILSCLWTVKAITENTRPRGATTAPAAPFTRAGLANR